MIVLSIESPSYSNQAACTTHKVLGASDSPAELIQLLPSDVDLNEEIVIFTDLHTGRASRVTAEMVAGLKIIA